MSDPIKVYNKTVAERRRLYLDYSCWLEATEKLTTFQAIIAPLSEGSPLNVTTSFPDVDHKRLMMYVSGGVANTKYIVSMVVDTDGAQRKQDDIGIKVN